MTRVCGDVKNGWEFCDEKGVLLSPPRYFLLMRFKADDSMTSWFPKK